MSAQGLERAGWELRHEPAPSIARHFFPIFGGQSHRMSSTCWCRPFLQNEASYTVVMHNQFPTDNPSWPIRSQL